MERTVVVAAPSRERLEQLSPRIWTPSGGSAHDPTYKRMEEPTNTI